MAATLKSVLGAMLFALLLFPAVMPLQAQEDDGTLYYFDPSNVGTLSGTVADFDSMLFYDGTETFTHVLLALDNGEMIFVVLCPGYFLQSNSMVFKRGDRIEVTGSKVGEGERTFIIATSVKKGGKDLQLRNQSGVPLWLEEYMRNHQ